MLEAYGRSSEQLEPLVVTMSLEGANGGAPASTIKATLGETMSTGSGVVRRASFALPLAGHRTGRLPGAREGDRRLGNRRRSAAGGRDSRGVGAASAAARRRRLRP